MKQFICMKWGTLYGPDYVNTLYRMVSRNVSGPFRFVCLTDDAEGILSDVETLPCPEIDLPAPHNNRGWRKLNLYAPSERLFGLEGDWLYLDLDVVVTGSLDLFFDYQREADFIVMQNWTQPGEGIGNTSCYRFRVGSHSYLLDDLVERQEDILARFRNSQTYISRSIRQIEFWPDEWCVLFKTHCVPPWPERFWKEPMLPETAHVVAFPGVPNPHQAVKGEWPAPWYKKSYKFIRPARWIERYWQ
ncbi:MAG: hypothetical protein LC667_17755 [Thioalkalivibrio sp.]|nr:hypothetical protein [Thioalkalivibrio sp.]